MEGLGLHKTRLRRRMMDLEAARRGEENASTPAEMRALLEAVRAGKGLKPALAKDLLEVAATPKSSPFRRPLPAGLRVADKPGSLEGVRAVAAIVELPRRPYVAAIATTYLKRDQDARKRALADPAGRGPTMIAVDTNVVVRLLVRDDAAQSRRARPWWHASPRRVRQGHWGIAPPAIDGLY
jgi:hypothetical protein